MLYKYNGSPGAIVMACFPAHAWVDWKFNFRAKEIQKKEIVDFVKKLGEDQKIEELEKWYSLPLDTIKDTAQLEFIKRHGGLHGTKGGRKMKKN